MIDRTTLDLRLAEHHTTTARIDARDWQRQGPRPASAARARLATRLDPAAPTAARREDRSLATAHPS